MRVDKTIPKWAELWDVEEDLPAETEGEESQTHTSFVYQCKNVTETPSNTLELVCHHLHSIHRLQGQCSDTGHGHSCAFHRRLYYWLTKNRIWHDREVVNNPDSQLLDIDCSCWWRCVVWFADVKHKTSPGHKVPIVYGEESILTGVYIVLRNLGIREPTELSEHAGWSVYHALFEKRFFHILCTETGTCTILLFILSVRG